MGANNDIANDECYDTSRFNQVFSGNCDNDLKLFHLNIRSLPRKINSFENYLNLLKQKFDIICISETWINEGRFFENCFDDYNLFFSKRPANKAPGGGCAIFVKKSFVSCELTHLSCNLEHMECVFVEVTHRNKKFIVSCFYRTPNSNNARLFIDDLTSKLSQLSSSIPIFCLGDYNFDLLRIDHDRDAESFLDAMFSVGLRNTISEPTRDFEYLNVI